MLSFVSIADVSDHISVDQQLRSFAATASRMSSQASSMASAVSSMASSTRAPNSSAGPSLQAVRPRRLSANSIEMIFIVHSSAIKRFLWLSFLTKQASCHIKLFITIPIRYLTTLGFGTVMLVGLGRQRERLPCNSLNRKETAVWLAQHDCSTQRIA